MTVNTGVVQLSHLQQQADLLTGVSFSRYVLIFTSMQAHFSKSAPCTGGGWGWDLGSLTSVQLSQPARLNDRQHVMTVITNETIHLHSQVTPFTINTRNQQGRDTWKQLISVCVSLHFHGLFPLSRQYQQTQVLYTATKGKLAKKPNHSIGYMFINSSPPD